MSLQLNAIRTAVFAFDWQALFVDQLNWNRSRAQTLDLPVADTTFTLVPIAEQGGMLVYRCTSTGALPDAATRRMIEVRVKELRYEHLLIFEDAARSAAVLQWVKRGQGTVRPREYTIRKDEARKGSGEALIQRLAGIAFNLTELDASGQATIAAVTAKVAGALDAEDVTKSFFREFLAQRDAFEAFVQGLPLSASTERRWFVSIMLNRLMFIAFVQAKGFLNNDQQYLANKLTEIQRGDPQHGPDRYYTAFLHPLFFEGFARMPHERDAATSTLLGDIPYLNGGLFVPHALEEQYGAQITIADAAFERLFAFFGKWRWHLSERPGTAKNEIDPDVLGYIFEKYINNQQKQMGAYYTKEDITGYICRSTIIPALMTRAQLTLDPLDLRTTIASYLYDSLKQEAKLPTETDRELAARRARVQQLIAAGQAGTIATITDAITANLNLDALIYDLVPQLDKHEILRLYHALVGLSVLDPTCGSGAFLFAAIRVLTPIYELVLDRMQRLAELQQAPLAYDDVLKAVRAHPSRAYFITKSIVVRNLYGVDIMEEAAEICKLRLFLRMVADLHDQQQIEPLPDIDFNIRAGNALVGYARVEEIGGSYTGQRSIAALSPRQQRLVNDITVLQLQLRTYRSAQLENNPSSAEFRALRTQIRNEFERINTDLDNDLVKLGQLTRDASGRLNTRPLHWFTAFYEIIDGGGFDVIVGNPPYLEIREIDYKQSLKNNNLITGESGAIHAMIMEKSIKLLKQSGSISMIVPLALVSTQRMHNLQNIIEDSKTVHYSNYSWRPGKLFDAVNRALTIFVANSDDQVKVFSTNYQKWYSEIRDNLIDLIMYVEVPRNRTTYWVPKFGNEIERDILNKVIVAGTQIQDFLSEKGAPIYYRTTGGLYWKVFTNFPPKFSLDGNPGKSSRETTFFLKSKAMILPVVALLSSNLFWWWYTISSNLRDLNPSDIYNFRVKSSILEDEDMKRLGEAYIQDLQRNSKMLTRSQKQTGLTETQSFKIQLSKPIIDEIDRVLAQHYGFTAEELDFIINYDIKYRMGRDAAAGDDE